MSESIATVPVCNDQRLIPCRAGLRPIPNSHNETRLWVQSPRTGKTITIASGWLDDLRRRAPRLVGKVAQARSTGKAVVMLSIAELMAFAELHKLIAERCKPAPVGGLYRRFRRYKRRPYKA